MVFRTGSVNVESSMPLDAPFPPWQPFRFRLQYQGIQLPDTRDIVPCYSDPILGPMWRNLYKTQLVYAERQSYGGVFKRNSLYFSLLAGKSRRREVRT
jgi:hypothetical protein